MFSRVKEMKAEENVVTEQHALILCLYFVFFK